MNVLVVFTHPAEESLNRSFLNSTLEGLKANPQLTSIEVLDLYKEGFDPALVFNRDRKRRDMHKDMSLEKYRRQITKADTVIFIYPIWWGRPPAMLLGYFDRILASDFAYRIKEGSPFPEGLLEGKQVICLSTMQGPAGYPALFLNNAHKVLMKKAVLNFVGIKKVKFMEFGSMEQKGGKQKKKIAEVYWYMKGLTPPVRSSRRKYLEELPA